MAKERADVLCVSQGLFESREKAKRAIMAGIVYNDNIRIDKAGEKVESTAEAGSVKKSTATTGTVENNSLDVTFTLKINSGSEDSIREMLTRLEKSIRTFKVTNVKIEYSLDKMNVTVAAKAYYEPAKVVELTEKVVKP